MSLENNKKLDKNYKFKDLRVFSSTETMEGNTKRYRRVFDNRETSYLYAELTFYNKLFDEEDWKTKVKLKAYSVQKDGRKELCNIERDLTVSKDQNIVIVREGWGNKEVGTYWLRGDYEWEAYINEELVSTQKFYIEAGGMVTEEGNPYFNIKGVQLYEGPNEGVEKDKRKYLQKFNASETQYVWVEFAIENKQTQSWYCELIFNFYNDAGQLKGNTSEMKYVADTEKDIVFTTGWGATSKGTWYHDKYTLEVVFMDQLVAVVPFEVGDQVVEGTSTVFTANEVVVKGNEVKQEEEESLEDLIKELQSMIGLSDVKTKVNDYTHYLKFLNMRKEQGFEENQSISLHSVFVGNPGTGKTTVAKLIGKIYHKMGLLSKGKVTEVGRSELVGKYIGQTAPQTKEVIEKARGGVLFIDEAYALMREGDSSNDFGQEAIEVLLKEMSDGPGDIAIIVAGYPKEMESFLAANPGLKSRFNLFFQFDDYLPQELLEIADHVAVSKNVDFTEESRAFLYERIIEAYRNRDRTFGNARYVTSLVEESKMNMGLRVMRESQGIGNTLSPEQLKTIEISDVQQIFKTTQKGLPDLKVDELLLNEALTELNLLTGLEEVKTDVHEMVKLVKFYKETGKDVLNKFSLHTVFTGNPGTGKTTVARIVAKIYKALGILERGHLVETDRQGLVAGYVGQTAIKTIAAIDAAEGGVLFIDEAYALSSRGDNDFGQEAVETLLKQMEDRRGRFVVIVAGYTDNMNQFLQMNPGLKSRFDRVLNFADYTVDDLYKISSSMMAADSLKADAQAEEHLKNYLKYIYSKRDKFFGNARSVRKVVKEVVKNQHLRMASLSPAERTLDAMSTVVLDDVKEFNFDGKLTESNQSIGFRLSAGSA